MSHLDDATVQVVHDALAYATAAVDGDVETALAVADDALALDRAGFLDALASVVQVLADEVADAGGDVREALRELGLGVHLAHLAELAGDPTSSTSTSSSPSSPSSPNDPDRRS
ncbi:hypothetical protein FTX61_10905 [Nitriliruptoraceae bacterium ZYF776]|nr:hypothetical protein [Profundirhabdus halotolerans]